MVNSRARGAHASHASLPCRHAVVSVRNRPAYLYALQQEKDERLDMRVLNSKAFLASVLAVAVVAGGVYSVARSVKNPAANGTYTAHTTGAAARIDRTERFDWSDRVNTGFDE